MGFWRSAILILLCGLLSACSSASPTWRAKAAALADDLARQNAPHYFPQEYRSFLETYEHGEAIFHVHEDDQTADQHYLLALQKGDVLVAELRRLKAQEAETERRRIAEREARAEEERLMREAAEAEARLKRLEERRTSEEAARAEARQSKSQKEHATHLPTSYTVRRGETLPQIAGRAEIYNNSSLWPLIYRANRDQIRDPKRLWPGQVLVIPRN